MIGCFILIGIILVLAVSWLCHLDDCNGTLDDWMHEGNNDD